MIKYDYIIVGGGSAGCLTASRLVKEFSANVLIIEQGSSDWNPMIHIPSGFIPMLSADGVIVIGGGSGTLSEICAAYMYKKPIVALKNSGGTASKYSDRYLDHRKNKQTG